MIRGWIDQLMEEKPAEKRAFPKSAIIGAEGFLGSEFFRVYREKFPDCTGTTHRKATGDILKFDLRFPNIASLKLSKTGHKAALILAARPGIEYCEQNKTETSQVNVTGTIKLVRQLADEGIKPIFFSSDYVFNGITGNYSDGAKTDPITEYGRQKAELESEIPKICGINYLIVRLSKVFSLEKGSGTLLDEMASILAAGGVIKAAYDQIFNPTYIQDVINSVVLLQSCGASGIFNVCSPESWARYDLAIELAKVTRIDTNRVRKISLDDIFVKAKRPKNTSMLPAKLMAQGRIAFTPMSDCIRVMAGKWVGK